MGTVLPLEGLKLDHLGKKDGAGWQKSDGMYFPDVLMPQIRCYTCVNADSHEECNAKGPIVCKNSQASCETEVRVVHVGTELRPRITKGCKQSQACYNNHNQNKKPGWPSTQCNDIEYFPLSVCRYCCRESGCNSDMGVPHCKKLQAPRFGTMKCEAMANVSTSVCSFNCPKCFKLRGSATRTCMPDKTWSGTIARCVYDPACSEKQCNIKMTRPIRGGEVFCSKGPKLGSICEFECRKNYHIFGKKNIECVQQKAGVLKWDSERPRCAAADTKTNPCHEFAFFEFSSNGSLTCTCRAGFQGDGIVSCQDLNECADRRLNKCHEHATCINTVGSYVCNCNPGFTGNGLECTDIDECMNGNNNCDPEGGICINNIGRYSCTCAPSYTGNGRRCSKVKDTVKSCPDGKLLDGLYCIRKNVTVEIITTTVPLTTTVIVTTSSFATTTSMLPAEAMSTLPEEATSKFPVETTSTLPEEATSGLPITTTSSLSQETTSELPVEKTSMLPADTTSTLPEKTTSNFPAEITSMSTKETTVSVILQQTTSDTVDVTTSRAKQTTDSTDQMTDAATTASQNRTTTASQTTAATSVITTVPTTVPKTTTARPEEDWCVSFEKGTPAVMKDAETYKQINSVLQARVVPPGDLTTVILGPWIGLDDRLESGVLRWRDGCILKDGEFAKWAPNEPKLKSKTQNCVHLVSDHVAYGTRDFLWKVLNCNDNKRYKCETEKTRPGTKPQICKPGLSLLVNGEISCSDGWNLDSVCSFNCNSGYVLRENYNKVLCSRKTKKWDRTPPACIRAVCNPSISSPSAGNMTCTDSNNVGSVCKFSCNVGYRIKGSERVTCRKNLEWSSSRPCCRDDCPPYARMNLIFVLDSSSSVGIKNFYEIKRFVKSLQSEFVASLDFTQVAAVVYHSDVVLLKNKKSFESNVKFEEALRDLRYMGVGTLTGQALDFVADNFVNKRAGATDVVVLLTDGKSQDDVIKPAERLRQANAHIIAVGVEGANWKELKMIATRPTIDNVVHVNTFKNLKKTILGIRQRVCNFQC